MSTYTYALQHVATARNDHMHDDLNVNNTPACIHAYLYQRQLSVRQCGTASVHNILLSAVPEEGMAMSYV